MHEYDLIADWYAADRKTDIGVPEVTALVCSLPPGATVLDVGCGTGVPLTQTLLQAGCDVVGVDSSPRMLERFRLNCPDTPAICSPARRVFWLTDNCSSHRGEKAAARLPNSFA